MPKAFKAINVPTKETGIVTQGINVALKSPKNINIIKITINEVKSINKNHSNRFSTIVRHLIHTREFYVDKIKIMNS